MRLRLQNLRQGLNGHLDVLAVRLWQWDHKCLDVICGQPRLKRVSRLFVLATYFGDGYLWVLVGVGMSTFGTSVDRRRLGILAIITFANIAVFRLSKRAAKRDRPDPVRDSKNFRFRYLDSYSFPSGHATTSFGMAYMLATFYPVLPVQIAAYTASTLIAFSRVYVGEHYPSDVISGALLGVLSTSLLLPIVSRFFF